MKKIILLILALATPLMAQISPVLGGPIDTPPSGPSGTCGSALPMQYVYSTGVLYGCQNGTWASLATGGGGTGTVTSVSVTTANGVSGTVATATTTPAITLSLGAITPTSVTLNAATGTGIINIPSGTTTANAVEWGTDACLYRSATATLATGCGATTFAAPATILGTDYDASATALTGQVSLGGAHVASGVYLNYATANANPAVVIRQANASTHG